MSSYVPKVIQLQAIQMKILINFASGVCFWFYWYVRQTNPNFFVSFHIKNSQNFPFLFSNSLHPSSSTPQTFNIFLSLFISIHSIRRNLTHSSAWKIAITCSMTTIKDCNIAHMCFNYYVMWYDLLLSIINALILYYYYSTSSYFIVSITIWKYAWYDCMTYAYKDMKKKMEMLSRK